MLLDTETQWSSSDTTKITASRIRLPARSETSQCMQLDEDGHSKRLQLTSFEMLPLCCSRLPYLSRPLLNHPSENPSVSS